MTRQRRIIGQGRHLRLIAEDGWEYSERIGASGVVVILALTQENQVVMVEQYRHPLKQRVLELPAGLSGDLPDQPCEAFEEAARRELKEETGFYAGKLELLLAGPSAAGSSNTIMHFFLATQLSRAGEGGADVEDGITVHVVPFQRCEAFIASKQAAACMIDPKLYTGLYFAAQRLGLKPTTP